MTALYIIFISYLKSQFIIQIDLDFELGMFLSVHSSWLVYKLGLKNFSWCEYNLKVFYKKLKSQPLSIKKRIINQTSI